MNIVNRSQCKPFITKDGSQIIEIMAHRNSACNTMSLAEAMVQPGQCTEAHLHPQSEEIYYILSGSGEVRCDEVWTRVGAGDAVLHPPGRMHQIRNCGTVPLVFLCLCSPGYEHDDTVLAELPPGQE